MKNICSTLLLLCLMALMACQNKQNTTSKPDTAITQPTKPVFEDGYPLNVTDVMLDSLYDFYFWVHHRDVTDRAVVRFKKQIEVVQFDKLALMKSHRRLAVAYMMAYEKDKCSEHTNAMTQLATTLPLDDTEKAKIAATQAYYYYWFDIANKNGYNNITIADSLMRVAVSKNDILSVQMHFLKGFYAGGLGFRDKSLQNIDSAFIDYTHLPIAYVSVEAWAHAIRSLIRTSNIDGDMTKAVKFFDNPTWANHPAWGYSLYAQAQTSDMTNLMETRTKIEQIDKNTLHTGHLWQLHHYESMFESLAGHEKYDKAMAIINLLLNEPKANKVEINSRAAEMYAAIGKPKEVGKYVQKITDLIATTTISTSELGEIYDHLGYAYSVLFTGDKKTIWIDKANIYWKKGLDCYEQSYGSQNLYYNGVANGLACGHALRNDFNKAIDFAYKALYSVGYDEKDKDFKNTLSLNRLSLNAASLGFATASKYIFDKSDSSYHQAEDALNLFYRIDEKINNITQNKPMNSGRYVYLNFLHYAAIDRNLAVNNPDKAFYYAEKLKQFTFRNNINFDPKALNAPVEIFDEEKLLRAQISNLQKKISEFGDKQGWSDLILTKQNRLHKLMVQLKTDYPKFYNMRFNYEPAKLSDIQHAILDDSTAFIEYCVADSAIYAFTILKDTIKSTILPKSLTFEDSIQKFRMLLGKETTRPIEFTKYGTDFYNKLLSGIISNLPTSIRKLIIVPDGVLSYVPFEVLTPSQVGDNFRKVDFFLKYYQISYAYSASLLLEQKQIKSKKTSKLFAGFAPKYDKRDTLLAMSNITTRIALTRDGAYELPEAKNEVKEINAHIGGKAYLEQAATEGGFKKEANKYRILHFAMHSTTDDAQPMFSKLLFTLTPQDTTEDNDLTAGELYGMKLNADLAVLSACNTGYGTISRGEGVMSLARAFTYAGVPATVTSLWKVSDMTTRDIMVDFYKNLKLGMTKDAALRQAKLTYIQNAPESAAANPYYWAAFVPMGNMAAMDMSDGYPLSIWGIGLGILAILGLLYWYWNRKKST